MQIMMDEWINGWMDGSGGYMLMDGWMEIDRQIDRQAFFRSMKNVKNESFIIIKKQYVEENSNVIKFFF